MIDWSQGGLAGSLKRWVAHEVKSHLRSNATLRAARYPMSMRFFQSFMAGHTFAWFVAMYISVDLLLVLIDVLLAMLAPKFGSGWVSSSEGLRSLLKDAASYFIIAQVGALGIVSIAVGLVTLIAQRQNSTTDVQIYYHESLAQEVVASSIALLTVLCVQVFWPAQLITNILGLTIPSDDLAVLLTIIHTLWLIINLSALAHFVSLSLRFVQPGEREAIRESYTANWVIQRDITKRLERALYLGAARNLLEDAGGATGPLIIFGYNLDSPEQVEIETTFSKPVVLYDVLMRPLGWVLRRWWSRCQQQGSGTSGRFGQNNPRITFTPYFERTFQGRIAWCNRHNGVPLTPLERFLIRRSFRFRRTNK